MLDENTIIKALEFYKIDDISYKNKCLDALKLINSNKNLYNKCISVIDYLMNEADDYKLIEYAKKNYYEVFKCDNKYITNVIVLSLFNKHNEFLNRFDDEFKNVQINNLKKRLLKEKDGMDIRRLVKNLDYIKGKIFEVGCLQFQITNIYFYDCNIKIHIPRNVDFTIENVLKSINDSKYYLKKYYDISNPKYYCDSWMLGKTTRKCLKEDSNIYKFGDLFDIKENEESNEILRFVYKDVSNDYSLLSEDTSLQRNLKEKLLSKEKMYNGIGVLK